MAEIACFLLEPTGRERRWLRRYAGWRRPEDERACPTSGFGYHTAKVQVEDGDEDRAPAGHRRAPDADQFKGDPRWPLVCACGYVFDDLDERDVTTDAIMRRSDTGELTTIRTAPPGAMWYADWMIGTPPHEPGTHKYVGPDGHCLVVRVPGAGGLATPGWHAGHDWCVDGPASNGAGWDRTGVPPKVTATPSIGVHGAPGAPWVYHGWLRDGVLRDA